jgi:hypothetical protein
VDGRLDKRKKGVYGPSIGRKAVVFVDDLNMPSKEVYGAQPPIELLRQFMDYGGWYGRDNVFRTMVDVQFVAAMGPPGGGRTFITNRYQRHFHCLALSQVGSPLLSHKQAAARLSCAPASTLVCMSVEAQCPSLSLLVGNWAEVRSTMLSGCSSAHGWFSVWPCCST